VEELVCKYSRMIEERQKSASEKSTEEVRCIIDERHHPACGKAWLAS
jgi:hypothetical protein